jgi:uncharacterized lipoprotein
MQFAATAVMKPTILITATAVALAGLAGCDRKPEQRAPATTSTYQTGSGAAGGTTAPQSNTPTTPANLGTPSASERSPMAQPPVQGREDVRQPEQRKDFEQKGDSAGPKPGG